MPHAHRIYVYPTGLHFAKTQTIGEVNLLLAVAWLRVSVDFTRFI